ncbi:diacylglycerol/lipid kinase family protein [Alteribacillus iranensis]|uniref:Lipid kinase, YegS/Rv2252/BmrU family n=1 Tax=Alteribacillus iranensis TaxID=930128 RepID=A0A1I2FAP0_9BACI|nr:diacylglycerol kinase family protein [Alteribacillus iranensis]SFF02534.1 lipid kinase, YegS/Rv2252/BmrU family [Alteribacillus iranensis]
MYEKGLMLVNGSSSQLDLQKNIELVTGVLVTKVNDLTIRKTSYKGEAEDFSRNNGEEFDVIFILGGDGLVHETINGLALLSDPPVIGILPGGTCNDFSRSLSIPQPLKRAAETLADGSVRYVDIGQMNHRYFTNFLGLGLIADTSENINPELKGVLGRFSYFISAVQMFNSAEPFSFTMKLDKEVVKDEAVMVLIANGRFLGTNLLPFPEISLDDGLFNIFVINEGGVNLLREYISAKNPFMWDTAQSDIKQYTSQHIHIETAGTKKADTDGEIYMRTPVTLKNLNQKLPFIVPASLEDF